MVFAQEEWGKYWNWRRQVSPSVWLVPSHTLPSAVPGHLKRRAINITKFQALKVVCTHVVVEMASLVLRPCGRRKKHFFLSLCGLDKVCMVLGIGELCFKHNTL